MNLFRANGKLLISGEYAVLDGALAFAVPTRPGQTLEVEYLESNQGPDLRWDAFLQDGSLWFSAEFELSPLSVLNSSDAKFASKLLKVFQAIEQLSPNFFRSQTKNIRCRTQLEFPRDWGLGSSSALIYLLSRFSGADAFELNKLTFNTSGYDVACAGATSPIFFQNSGSERKLEPVEFHPPFAGELFFVHLNKKQDTQTNVSENYRGLPKNAEWLDAVSAISFKMAKSQTLREFERLMNLHEELISSKLNLSKAKDLYFSDYPGEIKSLGAWGGDFIMATGTGREEVEKYFHAKGHHTILGFKDLFIC